MGGRERGGAPPERRRRPALKGLLACALALSLAYAGYGAWAVYLRDRNIFDELLYCRASKAFPDGLYGQALARKWAPEGFGGLTDQQSVREEDAEQEWRLAYRGGNNISGTIRISLKKGSVSYYLSRSVEGADGKVYLCSPHWLYDAQTRTLACTGFEYSLNDGSAVFDSVPEDEFFAQTGWTRKDAEDWADWALWGFFIPKYLERNAGKTRFSADDVGELRVSAPWHGGGDGQ